MTKPMSMLATAIAAFGIGLLLPVETVHADTSLPCGDYCEDDCPSQYGFWNGQYYETQYWQGTCQFGFTDQVICDFTNGYQEAFWCTP